MVSTSVVSWLYGITPVFFYTKGQLIGDVINIVVTFTSHCLFLVLSLGLVSLEVQVHFPNPPADMGATHDHQAGR